MREAASIYVVGIGGQGVMRLAEILTMAADRAGFRVVLSEVKGGAQRGGLAAAHVRLGPTVLSPMIPPGEADVIVGLEVLEAARAAPQFLRPGGTLIVNTEHVPPLSVMIGRQTMPDPGALWQALAPLHPRMLAVPATSWALELGRRVLANTILLGALARTNAVPLEAPLILSVIEEAVPPGTVELNRKAFERGLSAVESASGPPAGRPGPSA